MKRTSYLDELCLPTIQELALKFHTDGEIALALKERHDVILSSEQISSIRLKYRVPAGHTLKLWALRERVDKSRKAIKRRMEERQSDTEIARDFNFPVGCVRDLRKEFDIPNQHIPKQEDWSRDTLKIADAQFTRLMNACGGSFRSDVKTKCVGKVSRADPILPLTQSSIASCG